MLIIKSKYSGNYLPADDADLPMFRHCCEGMIEVKDISFYVPVFNAHGIQVAIQEEAKPLTSRKPRPLSGDNNNEIKG